MRDPVQPPPIPESFELYSDKSFLSLSLWLSWNVTAVFRKTAVQLRPIRAPKDGISRVVAVGRGERKEKFEEHFHREKETLYVATYMLYTSSRWDPSTPSVTEGQSNLTCLPLFGFCLQNRAPVAQLLQGLKSDGRAEGMPGRRCQGLLGIFAVLSAFNAVWPH